MKAVHTARKDDDEALSSVEINFTGCISMADWSSLVSVVRRCSTGLKVRFIAGGNEGNAEAKNSPANL